VSDRFRIEPLKAEYDRSGFVCGSELLDGYFRTRELGEREIAGYYTLSATSVALEAPSPRILKKLPRYPVVPAALLGRRAVARSYQGLGLRGVLIADALKRVAQAEMGVFALVVDAKDESAQRFYERYGFILLPGEKGRLFLPIDTAALRRLA
jgi:GNAT superfamily N-acetyltransferase